MKFYFAGSIRGAGDEGILKDNQEIIGYLKTIGEVLTEHVGDKNISGTGQKLPDNEIHDRDLAWINESDIVIANVSTPSLGVGYEVRKCIEIKKPTLCLYKKQDKKLSAMIAGSGIRVAEYETVEGAINEIEIFLKEFEKIQTPFLPGIIATSKDNRVKSYPERISDEMEKLKRDII